MTVIALSCSKQNEETLSQTPSSPSPSCDTANMKYAANVVPILQSNCYSCHGESTNSNSNGILLEGYSNLKARADNGQLLGVITHADGFPAMPQGVAKLSDCNINIIRSWINNGAQNN